MGIDLNCGKDNSYVLPGDFHRIVFPANLVEAVYTNVMDHVFDLSRFMAEVNRVLKPGAIFIVDMLNGYDEGFVPGEFEAMYWRNKDILIDRIEKAGGLQKIETRDLGKLRKESWTQVVFGCRGDFLARSSKSRIQSGAGRVFRACSSIIMSHLR